MTERKILNTPFRQADIEKLQVGSMVYISGAIYTGRDAAHKRMCDMLAKGEMMPFDFDGQIIFYAGPCPNRPDHIIGSVGPTTSGRMDAYTPLLIKQGLKAMIGKGLRNKAVIDAIKEEAGVYFAAVGGAAALLSKCVKAVDLIAYEDLGTEAIRKLTVENFPVIVAIDSQGNNMYSK